MANSTIPNLVAVSVPALTDLFGVRQSGDTRDKKLTATQLLSLVSVPDPLLLGDGSVGAPTYSFTSDSDSGVALLGADQLSLIAGGQEMARLTEGVGVNQFAIKQSGASTVPDLTSLGDPDTGFRWTGGNEIIAVHSNVRSWHFLQGSFFADASDGPILFNTFGSATVPSICVERGDPNTGFGRGANDAISLICGGVEGLRLTEASLGVIQVPEAGLAITAFATGGQTNAVQLNSSYNVIGTVATTGDSVKLLPTFAVNSIIFIKNDGANAADVFPGIGDDLGAGLNTAVSLASGASISFIATTASSTWTQWIISVAPGGGIAAVVDDPSPQLGGDLDTNGSNIVNADTTLTSLAITAGTDPAVDGGDLDLSSGDSGVGATGNAGAVNILAGESVATTGDGGVVSIKSGAGFFQGAGGDILIEVGTGGAAGPGTSGRFFVNTLTGANAAAGLQVPIPGLTAIYGVGRSGSGPAANLELWGGYASGAGGGSIGGNLMLFGGGQGGGSGEGGDAILVGGESDTQPGDAKMVGGVATTSGPGGIASVAGGAGFGTNQDGGNVVIAGGVATGVGTDGNINMTVGNLALTAVATSPALVNEASTNTNPTLIPRRDDLDTGIGAPAGGGGDQLSLIAGGVEAIRITEAASAIAAVTILGPILATDGSAGAPSYTFNSDLNTGIIRSATDHLDLIAGGLSCMSVRETGSARQIGFYVTAPISLQTGVAVTDVAIHAALVALGLITA